MPWDMKASDSDFEQPPTGPQPAVLTRIIDIGTHTDVSPQFGEQTRHQVVFTWELAELMDSGKPYIISAFYTLSTHPKANLRLMLEGWRGKAYQNQEVVEIDKGHATITPVALSTLQLCAYALFQRLAIEQPGQRVVGRQEHRGVLPFEHFFHPGEQ